MPEERLAIHCFPSTDVRFRRFAEQLLSPAGQSPSGSEAERSAFEVRLRAKYPAAAVWSRDSLAALGVDEVWYVYRGDSLPTSDGWRVLIVEDNRDLARMMEAAIAAEGAEVRAAEDGESALALTDGWRPDAIVLDLGLPKLDGPGFAAAYRQRAGDVPIVVVSGNPEAPLTSQRIGARAWLPKPFELDALIELVRPSTDQVGSAPQ